MADKAAAPADKTEEKADEKVTDNKAADKAASEKAAETPAEKSAKTEKTFTKAELDAANKKAVEDAQKKWDAQKDLSENERLKQENEELKAGNRLRDAKDEVVAALKAAGNNSPELAFRAIQGDLKFDEKTGKLLNAKDLIDGFKTSYPEQFGTEKPGEGIDGGAGQGAGTAKLTKEALSKMSPSEIQKLNWEDVKKAMAAN